MYTHSVNSNSLAAINFGSLRSKTRFLVTNASSNQFSDIICHEKYLEEPLTNDRIGKIGCRACTFGADATILQMRSLNVEFGGQFVQSLIIFLHQKQQPRIKISVKFWRTNKKHL